MYFFLKEFVHKWWPSRLRTRDELQRNLGRALMWLTIVACLHVVAMNRVEGLSVTDALWLTLTTATTVGYGDISPSTHIGRIATVVLIYGGGIFILAKFAGDYFEYRSYQADLKLKGEWRWHMQDHILILNAPIKQSSQYFERLARQFRGHEAYRKHPIQILTTRFDSGLPKFLHDLGVVHYHGLATDPASLQAVNARQAGIIVILAEHVGDNASDGISFDILHRLQDIKADGKILAECVDDRNRERLLSAGADVVIRPIRAYPAMIIRAFTAPGAEQVIENLFNHEGDEYRRVDVCIRQRWAQVVTRLVSADIGIPVAFVAAEDRQVISNPHPDNEIDAVALLVIVREGNDIDSSRVRDVLEIAS